VLSYPSAIDLSSRTLRFTADLLRRHRRLIGSRWRKLGPSRQALLVLAHLRCGDTYTRLAAGFGVGVATVWRYVTEVVDLLAAHAPGLAAAVQTAQGKAYVVLDGTLIAIDRVGMRAKADRPYYSGKHKRHGLNVQVLTDPAGRLIWASPALRLGARRESRPPPRAGPCSDRLRHPGPGRPRLPRRPRHHPRPVPGAGTSHRSGRGQHQPRPAPRARRTRTSHPQSLAPSAPAAAAARNAVPTSSLLSSPSRPPPEPEVGKGSLDRRAEGWRKPAGRRTRATRRRPVCRTPAQSEPDTPGRG